MSPFIYLLFIVGINIFFKSIGEKKKIEEARRKKMQELKKQENIKTVKEPAKSRREVERDSSIFKKTKEKKFFGEGKSYREDHEGYRDRYESRYENMDKKYDTIDEGYEKIENYGQNQALYDKNAIATRKKEHKDTDARDYMKEDRKLDIPVPKASTFKKDILNGIIFSEILGKPKSMQDKNI